MAEFKGDNSVITILPEDQGWALAPSVYTGAKVFRNNDGTFNATRNSLESEARTPESELAGHRLGNKSVAGSFPVELDPENYNELFRSALYSAYAANGAPVVISPAVSISSTKKYTITVPMTAGEQTTLVADVGSFFFLSAIDESTLAMNVGVVVIESKTATTVTFLQPNQELDTFSGIPSTITVTPMSTLRPAKTQRSFNIEETLVSEDGATTARFMTAGAIVSSFGIEAPSEGNVKANFSMIASDMITGASYDAFDAALTDNVTAHTATVPHVDYTPMVLQDGAIISGVDDLNCQWMSGSITIENGTAPYFVGCKFAAQGAFSGAFRVNITMELVFQGQADYDTFESEVTSKLLLRLKDRATDSTFAIYIPQMKKTAYVKNVSKGLVTASVTATAILDSAVGNSIVLGSYVAP